MSFIGESVRLPVRIEAGHVTYDGRQLPLAVAPGDLGGDAQLFLRPSELTLAGQGRADLSGTVRGVRRVAAGRRADVRVGPENLDLKLDVGDRPVAVGDNVALAVAGGRLFPVGRPSDA